MDYSFLLAEPKRISPQEKISLANMRRAGQLQELQLAEAQRQQQAQAGVRGVYANQSNVDPTLGTLTASGAAQLGQYDPAAMERAGEARNVALSQLSAQQLKQQQQAEKRRSVAMGVAQQVVSAYDLALERTGGNEQEAQRAALQARQSATDELYTSGLASTIGMGDAERAKFTTAPLDINALRATIPGYAEQEHKRNEPKSDLGKLEADRKAGRISQKDYDEKKKRLLSPTYAMMTSEMVPSDDALRFAAEQYWAGDPSGVQGYGRNPRARAAIAEMVTKVGRERGKSAADLAAATAEYQGIKAGQRTLGTRQANIDMAVTEALNVMPIALQASEKVDRTKYPTLNAVLLAAQKGTGDEAVVQLASATNSMVNIYSRAISPSGTPTVSDKEHAREILSSAYSKGQYRAAIDIMKREMEAAKAAPGQVREELSRATTGKGEGGGKAPQAAIDYLKAHPEAKEQFKAKYGYLP